MGFNHRKLEDQRREAAEKEAANRRVVELAWPNHPRRYFGKFASRAEAKMDCRPSLADQAKSNRRETSSQRRDNRPVRADRLRVLTLPFVPPSDEVRRKAGTAASADGDAGRT
jgi:hypothetical protein